MRRTLTFIALIALIAFVGGFGGADLAHAETTGQFQFQPIVSIPLPTGSGAVDASTSLTDYLNAVFTLSIGIAAILGVVMITFEGLKYMTSDLVGKKQSAVEGIQGAALGLTLLLLSYIILNVINPEILNLKALTEDLSALGGARSPAPGTPASPAANPSSPAATPSSLPAGTEIRPHEGTLDAGCVLRCRIDNTFVPLDGRGCIEPVQICSKK